MVAKTGMALPKTKRVGARASAPAKLLSGNKRGRDTKRAIVSAAVEVLIRHGYARFTMQRVASAAGIAVGNLSYHFPSKHDLLQRVVADTLDDYSRRFERLTAQDIRSLPAALETLTRWSLDDSTNTRDAHLLRELWAAALHNPRLREALANFYEYSINDALDVVHSARGNIDEHRLRLIVYIICLVSEGSRVLFSAKDRSSTLFVDIQDMMSEAVRNLVR